MSQSLSTGEDTGEEESEEDTVSKIISSFALPSVDLEDYDPNDNPLSDEQEIIYLYAPDPYGFHNPDALVAVDSYTQIGLGSSIAMGLVDDRYNYHVTVNAGDADDIWLVGAWVGWQQICWLWGYQSQWYLGILGCTKQQNNEQCRGRREN